MLVLCSSSACVVPIPFCALFAQNHVSAQHDLSACAIPGTPRPCCAARSTRLNVLCPFQLGPFHPLVNFEIDLTSSLCFYLLKVIGIETRICIWNAYCDILNLDKFD